MSKGTIIGVLLALFLIVLFFIYRSNKPDSRPQTAAQSRNTPISPKQEVSPRHMPKLTAPHRSQKTGQETDYYGSISGTVRIHGENFPAVGLPVTAITRDKQVGITQTDQKGSYTLINLPLIGPTGDHFFIEAQDEKAGLFMLSRPGVIVQPGEAKTGVNLTVYEGRNGSISGMVVGRRMVNRKPDSVTSKTTELDFQKAEDTPWPNVKIVLMGIKNQNRQETVSDESGRYRFDNLRPDRYNVSAEVPPGGVEDSNNRRSPNRVVEIASEHKADVDLHFRVDGFSIAGRITDLNGSPIEGAKVGAEYCISPEGRGKRPQKSNSGIQTVSDIEGRYQLGIFPPVMLIDVQTYVAEGKLYRWYEVCVEAEGFARTRRKVPPYTENLVNTGMRMTEENLLIRWRESEGRIELLSPFPDVELPNSQGDVINDIDFVMQKGAVVAGRVINTRGEIVTAPRAIRVLYVDPPSTNSISSEPDSKRDWTRLDSAGRFRIADLHAGQYRFEVTTERSRQQAKNEPLTVEAGDQVEDLTVVVEAAKDPGDIVGVLLNAQTRQPVEIPGVMVDSRPGKPLGTDKIVITRVEVDASNALTPVWGWTALHPSVKGGFLIENVTPGTATVEIAVDGYMRKTARVKVESGETTYESFLLEPRK